MRALVIDDEQLVLEGLEALLQAMIPDLSLDKTSSVGAAQQLAASVNYEVILLDWHLQGIDGQALNGEAFVKGLRTAGIHTPIVVVSGDDSPDWPRRVMELGLSGMVPKCASSTVLIDAINVALRGGVYLSHQSRDPRGANHPRRAEPSPADPRERYSELTVRQAEVFSVMIRGLSDKQIARELGISEATVKTHVRTILSVVGVNRRGQAVFEMTGKPRHG